MQPAVSAVQSYELTGNLLADTFTTNLDYLNTVHDALITGTAYLTTFLNSNVSYYADNSPVQQMINGFFLYYQNLQAVLMQMAIEAAHQGQPFPPPPNPPLPPAFPEGTDVFAPMPPNYQGAVEAHALYTSNIAEQETYLPFPTTGIGSSLPSPSSDAPGTRQIVFDRNTGVAWSSTNYANSVEWLSPPIFSTLTAIGDALKVPNAWMVRLPTYAEIQAFRASFPLPDQSNVVLGLTDIVNSMAQFGFALGLQQLGTGGSSIGYPYMTSDVLNSANWTFLNLRSIKHGGGGEGGHQIPAWYTQFADGYKCTQFFDLLNGVGIEVDIYCPVTGLTSSQTAPTDVLFADIQNATAIGLASSLGSLAAGLLNTSAYADALFIYQLANADSATGVNTDPPVEEPSSIQLTSVPSADGTTVQFSATGTFIRFDHYAGNLPVQINIADVFWASSDSDAASIDQSGLLTWKVGGGSVSVTATRGPLTQSALVTGPSTVSAPNLIPLEVNIYPRSVTILRTELPTEATFNGQILWSDGSTSTFGDGVSTTTPANPEASVVFPPFNYTFAEANGELSIDSGQQSTFTIQSGQIGPFQINLTVTVNGNSQQWTDHAALKTK